MKKILLILVGGTICTEIGEHNTLSVSEKAAAQIKANFLKSESVYTDKVEIIPTENLYILSENMTVDNWNLMLDTYRDYLKKDKYDGVIFAHGTDTLAYSASLFSIVLSNTDIPIFFVSSNKRLDLPQANGNDNFRCAVECICRGITPNVYVPYKNISDGQMYLHLASRIKQCENYSDDFHSIGAINISNISENNYSEYFEIIKTRFPAEKRKSLIDINGNWNLSNCVLMLTPYVGLNYNAFDYKQFSAVLHGTFHSGTACAEDSSQYSSNSILSLVDACALNNVDVYLSPAKLKGEIYDTVRIIGNHKVNEKHINFLYGCTNETAYAKILLAYSIFKDKKEIKDFINTECNFEIMQ